jgi:hypothetical protein
MAQGQQGNGGRVGWPELATPGWKENVRALHLCSQIVGKTKLALAPMANHWWQIPFYVTARGLSTSMIPYGARGFEVEFDLLDGQLQVRASDGRSEGFPLESGTVAMFHRRFFEALSRLDIDVAIHPLAVEISDTIYLDRDRVQRPYDPEWARRFFTALVQADRLLKGFRSEFMGKASPVHFFWGSFDLAVTRFSGRRAPLHPGGSPHVADWVMQESYSHEVSSAGFWPGGYDFPEAAFYAYAYPEPAGFADAAVAPHAAHYDPDMRIFVLPYRAVRESPSPDAEVKSFLESTYVAAAELGDWPRDELERPAAARHVSTEMPELHV